MKIYHYSKALAPLILIFTCVVLASPSYAAMHEVKMYNKDPQNKKNRMVFIPRVLKIKPGDTIKFVSAQKGHNTQSIKGMIPDGSEKWRSKISKDFELTLKVPGVYGYKCTPHFAIGMVGLIVVEGDNWKSNLSQAKKARKVGKAKKIFKQIWAELGVPN